MSALDGADRSLQSPDAQPVTARLAAAGSRRRELEAVLAAAPPTATATDYAALIVERNVAGKTSAVSRAKLLMQLRARYLLDPRFVEFAAFRDSLDGERGSAERGLICYLMMARCDRLFREAALFVVRGADGTDAGNASTPRRQGRTGAALDIEGFASWLRVYLKDREIAWSRETEEHAQRHVLSSLKDFGVLAGSARKTFTSARAGAVAAAFAARLSELEGLTGRQTLNSRWFALLGAGWEQAGDLLRSAARAGLLSFRMQAEVVELRLPPVAVP